MRRGQGQKRPLALCIAFVQLNQMFRRRRADLMSFYRALCNAGKRGDPPVNRRNQTWYRTVSNYTRRGLKWMDTDPAWQRVVREAEEASRQAEITRQQWREEGISDPWLPR